MSAPSIEYDPETAHQFFPCHEKEYALIMQAFQQWHDNKRIPGFAKLPAPIRKYITQRGIAKRAKASYHNKKTARFRLDTIVPGKKWEPIDADAMRAAVKLLETSPDSCVVHCPRPCPPDTFSVKMVSRRLVANVLSEPPSASKSADEDQDVDSTSSHEVADAAADGVDPEDGSTDGSADGSDVGSDAGADTAAGAVTAPSEKGIIRRNAMIMQEFIVRFMDIALALQRDLPSDFATVDCIIRQDDHGTTAGWLMAETRGLGVRFTTSAYRKLLPAALDAMKSKYPEVFSVEI